MKPDIDSPDYRDTNLGDYRMSSEEKEIERLEIKVAELKTKLSEAESALRFGVEKSVLLRGEIDAAIKAKLMRPPTDPAPTAAESQSEPLGPDSFGGEDYPLIEKSHSETGTPRTDAARSRHRAKFAACCGEMAKHAEVLERELQSLCRDKERLEGELAESKRYAEKLRGAINGVGPREVDYTIAVEKERDDLRTQLAQVTAERDAIKIWHDLGKLTVAIANGEAIPSSAAKLDDNPVNCVSFLLTQRDDLKARLEGAEKERDEAVYHINSMGCENVVKERDELRERLAAARKDSERLDRLEGMREKIFCLSFDNHPSDQKWSISTPPTDSHSGAEIIGMSHDLRQAIDAAISAQGRNDYPRLPLPITR